jgi:hypothetical protein
MKQHARLQLLLSNLRTASAVHRGLRRILSKHPALYWREPYVNISGIFSSYLELVGMGIRVLLRLVVVVHYVLCWTLTL